MGAILLIRHGQASFGKANYDKLSDLGIEQSAQAGRHFAHAGLQIHRLVTGKMVRHQETMEHCLRGMREGCAADIDTLSQHTPRIDDCFNEFDHEQVVARFRPDFEDKAAMNAWLALQPRPAAAFQILFDQAMRRWLSGDFDNEYKESWQGFRQRCIAGFESLLQDAGSGENIAVFTSGGPVSVITQHLLGVPDEHVLKLNYAMINASITKVFYNGERVSLSSFNSYSHLESASAPHLVTYR